MAYINKISFKGQEYEIPNTAAQMTISSVINNGGSVTNAVIDSSGHLIVTLSNGSVVDVGVARRITSSSQISKISFKGQEYEIKDTAARVAINSLMSGNGGGTCKDVVSVTNAEINQNGNLILTLSDGNTIDAGKVTGEDGDTPVRGVDYWTEEDIDEIKNYIDTSILNGSW